MRIHSKVGLSLLALVISLPLAPMTFGQDATPPPPPPSGMNGQAMQNHMRRQRMDRQWGQRNSWHGEGHWQHRHHRDFMLARLVRNPEFRERLGITPEQASRIRTQTFDFRKTEIRNHADLQIKRLELMNLLSATNPDRSAINKKLQEISAVRLTQAESAIGFHLDMRAALTPDQQQKLQQMRRDFFHHRGFGPGGSNGPEGSMRPSTNG